MKPLSEAAAAIFAAVPFDGTWVDVIELQNSCGVSLGAYYSHVAVLKRRGLVERDDLGRYRRTTEARR